MSATNAFTFELHQLTQPGKDLLAFAQKHPALFGLLSVIIVAGVVTIVVPIAMGFGAGGVVAKSAAAAWQSKIGNVVAGSFFAMLQSLTMTGTLKAVGGELISVGVSRIAGSVAWMKYMEEWAKQGDWASAPDRAGAEWNKGVEWAKGVDWARAKDQAGFGWGKGVEWAGGMGAGFGEWAKGVQLPIKL